MDSSRCKTCHGWGRLCLGGGQGSPLQNLSVVRDLHSEDQWSWDLGPPIIMSLCS